MPRCYFDTSAAVKMIRAEDYSADVRRWVADPTVDAVSSSLLEVELRRSAMRWDISQEEATHTLANFHLFGIPDWEFKAAGLIPTPGLRALDALHVAAAIRVEADVLITYDDRMAEAAPARGPAVVRPGVDEADDIRPADA